MKRNGMKNLCRFLVVLPLRACPELAEGVRGSQTCLPNKSFGRRGELRTLPPTPASPGSSFVMRVLASGLGLSFGPPCVTPPTPHARKYEGQTDETNRVYFKG